MGEKVSERHETCTRDDAQPETPQRVDVVQHDVIYDGFFNLERAMLRFELYGGGMSKPLERLLFERGDAVGVLPYDPEADRLVLVRQFRYPAHIRTGQGWIWEIIAGMQEEADPADVARREALEEAGYKLGTLRHVATVFTSPGACSERVHIFLAVVRGMTRERDGGGLPESGEDIEVASISLARAREMLTTGEIADAKTLIALQYLLLHRDELSAI